MSKCKIVNTRKGSNDKNGNLNSKTKNRNKTKTLASAPTKEQIKLIHQESRKKLRKRLTETKTNREFSTIDKLCFSNLVLSCKSYWRLRKGSIEVFSINLKFAVQHNGERLCSHATLLLYFSRNFDG